MFRNKKYNLDGKYWYYNCKSYIHFTIYPTFVTLPFPCKTHCVSNLFVRFFECCFIFYQKFGVNMYLVTKNWNHRLTANGLLTEVKRSSGQFNGAHHEAPPVFGCVVTSLTVTNCAYNSCHKPRAPPPHYPSQHTTVTSSSEC